MRVVLVIYIHETKGPRTKGLYSNNGVSYLQKFQFNDDDLTKGFRLQET